LGGGDAHLESGILEWGGAPASADPSQTVSSLLSFKAAVSADPKGVLRSWVVPEVAQAGPSSYAAVDAACSSWAGIACDTRGQLLALRITDAGLEARIDHFCCSSRI
jgi:hypothetical protein